MKLEKIYNKLNDINKIKNEVTKSDEIETLLEQIKQAIREESCLKTTSKTKVNAIKRVLKNVEDFKPVFKAWKRYEEYKVICNGYELYMINSDVDIPAKEAVEELPEGANRDDYEVGNYLDIKAVFPNEYNEKIKIDIKEVLTAVKTKERPIKLEGENGGIVYADASYIKNALDILGKNITLYYTGMLKPIVIENDKGEKGIVLPIRMPEEYYKGGKE